MEVRTEPLRGPRRLPVRLLVVLVLLAVAAVAVGASLAQPGALSGPPQLGALPAAAGAAAGVVDPGPGANPGALAGPDAFSDPEAVSSLLGGILAWPDMSEGRGGGFLPGIKITAIDGARVTLQSANGWTRVIDTVGVSITRAGKAITVGDLRIGDRIAVGETRGSDGTYAVKSLALVLDRVEGKVSKIDATSITVSLRGTKTATVKTDASTVYRRAGQTIARTSIRIGDRLTAVGTASADGSLQAAAVDVQADVVFGTLTAKSGSTLTIATAGGGTATVKVTSTTVFRVAGKTSATLADVAVKDAIMAQGVKGSDGVLTATTVRAGALGHRIPFKDGARPGPKVASPSPSATGGAPG